MDSGLKPLTMAGLPLPACEAEKFKMK